MRPHCWNSCFWAVATVEIVRHRRNRFTERQELVVYGCGSLLQVRAAGCRCLRSLSRSIKALQTNFDVVDLAPSLLPNLREDDASLQLPALYALCNLVVECSPAKVTIHCSG